MLRVALREEYKVIVPSFEGLIVRTERGGRALTVDEEKKLLAVYPPWMQRLAEFADETCLSQGDLLRVTEDMIDANTGIIRLNSGRGKTGVEQIPPLTSRCRQILDEIEADREQSKVRNVHGLVFTNPNGSPITKGQIEYQIEKAVKLAGIRKFVFHNYRNTALTRWAREGINVDVAMKASGHSSVQMHKRYVDLQETDIAAAFGTSQIATGIVTEERVANRK
jgi:integrase